VAAPKKILIEIDTCSADQCALPAVPGGLFCPHHWADVPKLLRLKLLDNFDAGWPVNEQSQAFWDTVLEIVAYLTETDEYEGMADNADIPF
jgi:hypothetical protein